MKQLKKVLFKLIKSSKKIKHLIEKYNIGTFKFRMNLGALRRNHYAYICYNAALLGKKLGYKKISVIEFGCAGGSGLVDLEYIASEIEKILNISFEIYGFDYGQFNQDTTHQRIKKYFDHFFYISTRNDNEVITIIKEHKIDIVIHRNGYSQNS